MFDLKGLCHGCFASSGGRVLPHISRIGICSPKGYSFCAPLVLKRGKDFSHFDLESGMGFEGTTG